MCQAKTWESGLGLNVKIKRQVTLILLDLCIYTQVCEGNCDISQFNT